jgi:hypothetical protein
METRFNRAPGLTAVTTMPRVTPTHVHVPFGEIMGKALTGGAELALSALPGGPLMAMALRNGANTDVSIQPLAGGTGTAPAAGGFAGGATSNPEGPGVSGATGTSTGGGELGNMQSAMTQSQEMNLQFLRLQEQVNTQNRSFTTLSNLMKAEHETVKTAIGNIR